MQQQQQPESVCPADVVRRAEILYHNGFMGFQGPPGAGKSRFVLCWTECFSEEEIAALRDASGAQTLRGDDWIGRDYLSVHWSEYGKRVAVLNAMLCRGHSFQTQTKGMPGFRVKEGDREFTYALLEKKVIAQCRSLLETRLVDLIDHACCEEWNYITEEGRAFARELRAHPLMYRYDTERTDFYQWPIMQNYDPETLLSLEMQVEVEEQPTKAVTDEQLVVAAAVADEKVTCMICLEKEADTMVLPCEHNVVCQTCSRQLAHTADAHICVQCRRPIQHTLY